MTLPDTKPCTHCYQVLPASAFYPKNNGLSSWCKACQRERDKERDRKRRDSRAEQLVVARREYRQKNQRKDAAGEIKRPARRVCGRCGETKPASQFYGQRSAKDGLQHWCIDCSRKENEIYRAEHG